MNKAKGLILVIATACIVVGLLMSGVAFAVSGFDFSMISTVERKVQEHFVASSANVETIVFEGLADDVRVERGAVRTIEVDYWGNDADSYRIEEKDGTLRVVAWFRPNIGVDFSGLQATPVVIRIPEAYNGTIELATASGGVAYYGEGSLAALRLSSISGEVFLGTVNVKGSVSLDSTSGSVRVQDLTASTVAFTTVSGAICFETVAAADLALHSTSGEVRGTVKGSATDYAISANSVSGEIRVPLGSATAGKSLDVSTVSGNIGIDFSR